MRGDLSVSFRLRRPVTVSSDAGIFVGASMTLVGLLPPLCDNGNMLVDGGYGEIRIPYVRVSVLT